MKQPAEAQKTMSGSGLLSTWLPQLDVPESARLVAVNTAIDDDGNTTWTVTFKQGPAGGSPLASPAKKHLTPGAAAADEGGRAQLDQRLRLLDLL